ncbi:MAG: fibronectin type III domain-containing protein, partial [Planctomycetota bacterium]
MIKKTVIKANILILFVTAVTNSGCNSSGPYQATGFKIGEVTHDSAIVWTRLTRNPQRVGSEAPMPEVSYRDLETGKIVKKRSGRPDLTPIVNFHEGSTVETIEGAVPGTNGQVRILYKTDSDVDWQTTGWKTVDTARDFTHQFLLTGLKPDCKYQVR